MSLRKALRIAGLFIVIVTTAPSCSTMMCSVGT